MSDEQFDRTVSTLSLKPEFLFHVACGPVLAVVWGPLGNRQYYAMTEGTITGARLNGRLLGQGADWMLLPNDGYMRMDVRIQIQTEDNATILAHYFGPAEANARLREAIQSCSETNFGDQAIRTYWILESGAAQYAWVNNCLFVGEGRARPFRAGVQGFEHRVYRVG